MMWVKLTLPPRERARWLLMTTRVSSSSLAVRARTLVAVGTCRLDSMLVTTRAEAPRSGLTSASLTGPVGRLAGASRVIGAAGSPPGWPSGAVVDGTAAFGAGLAAGCAAAAAGFAADCAAAGAGVVAGEEVSVAVTLPLARASPGW